MKYPQNRRGKRGFTLIEIMVVIAIIGLMVTLVAPNVMNKLREAKVTTTKTKMTQLQGTIEDYRRHHSRVPDSLSDLLSPDEKNLGEPYIDDYEKLRDAWGGDFLYSKTGSQKYEIRSLGADGVEGGENDDKDLSSIKNEMPG